MAERILNAQAPGGRTLVIAGNAHTALTPTMLGVPLGARLAEWRPGVREIHIRYGKGTYYNLSPQRFNHQFSLRRTARLRAEGGSLVLDLPAPAQAWVPHRRAADQPRAKPSPAGYTGAFAAYRDQPGLAAARAGRGAGVPGLPGLPAAGDPAGPAGSRRRRLPPRPLRGASRAVGPPAGAT